MKNLKRWLPLTVPLLVVALVVRADTVDQGMPGNQGPWPVTNVNGGGTTTDGGGFVSTWPAPCSVYKEQNTAVGASATIVPATPLASRIWVRICNSLLNTSSAQCICSATGIPTFTASSIGDPIAVSDCVLYNITAADAGVPRCICNGAGVQLPSAECAP